MSLVLSDRCTARAASRAVLEKRVAYISDPNHPDHSGAKKKTIYPARNYNVPCCDQSPEGFMSELARLIGDYCQCRRGKRGKRSRRLFEEIIYSTEPEAWLNAEGREEIERRIIRRFGAMAVCRTAWHVDEKTGRCDLHVLVSAINLDYPPALTLWSEFGGTDNDHIYSAMDRLDAEIADYLNSTPERQKAKTKSAKLRHREPEAHRDKVLMLDARNVFRKVTRKIYDFSPEQLKNLTAIVWLYRGENERFAALLEEYRDACRAKRREVQAGVPDAVRAFSELGSAIKVISSTALSEDFQRSLIDFDQEGKKLEAPILSRDYTKDSAALPDLAHTCKAWLHRFRDAAKAASANLATALQETEDAEIRRNLKRHGSEMEAAFARATESLEANNYFTRHLEWLLHRFPDGTYRDVPGLVKLVTLAEIEAADWSLTPGRYVGVAPAEADDEENFEEEMRAIHAELGDLNAEAAELAEKIQANFEELIG